MESKRVTAPGANAMPNFVSTHDTWSATKVPRSKARAGNRVATKKAKASRRANRR